MGLGKSVVCLTAIYELIFDYVAVSKVLVIAPKRVAEITWPDELAEWGHLEGLDLTVISGNSKKRAFLANSKAFIHTVGVDNLPWLIGHFKGYWPYHMVVIDESSMFKAHNTNRFKAIRMIIDRTERMVLLTGTPAPNGLIDLWPQLYLLDRGARLGKTITSYRETYFDHNPYQHKYVIRKGSEERIYGRIEDICMSMKAKDWIALPDRIDRTVKVRMSEEESKAYSDFERDAVLEMMSAGEEVEINAVNGAALANKLLQFSNGALYDDEKRWHKVHDGKIEALGEIIEESLGKPVLVFYSYKHDLERIIQTFGGKTLEGRQDVADWNAGKIKLLLAHPKGAAHGLNMQRGGHTIVWFGLSWSLELYQQANARLLRQGQKNNVIIHHIVTSGTIDEDVMAVIETKGANQERLMQAVKAKVEKVMSEWKK
jgi:SNF2 family DNA or RNA helicase